MFAVLAKTLSCKDTVSENSQFQSQEAILSCQEIPNLAGLISIHLKTHLIRVVFFTKGWWSTIFQIFEKRRNLLSLGIS